MSTAEDEVKANQQEIERLLERDRVYRGEISDLNTRITHQATIIDNLMKRIDEVREVITA